MPAPWRPELRCAAALLLLMSPVTIAAETVTVYAAASLTRALNDIAKEYRAGHDADLKFSFAGSGTLARQIEAGAPAQVFASADRQWMDYLEQRGLIADGSRRELLGNTLVLITPADRPRPVRMQKGFDLPASFDGKLCTGDTASVPAGIYAKEALQNLGWWPGLEKRIVGAGDVRTALIFVERGECPLGIVYRTDAIGSRVAVAGEFPANSHTPIIYPFALLPKATPAAQAFFRHLDGDAARAVFVRHGFAVLKQP
ncbi:MAG: molybdate ABC transporter substrate-binding protein [Pseudomonadota bacterium]